MPIQTLIIDPGHGGKDPGTVGKRKYEKEIALKVSLLLKDSLKKYFPRMKVLLTRDKDKFIPLHKRGEFAQENQGDFFISIHCNAMKNKARHGVETYVLGLNKGQEGYETVIKENESVLFEENHHEMYGGFDPNSPEAAIYLKLLKDLFRESSLSMAERIQKNMCENLGKNDRGVKQAPFVVLYMCGMPAVLTEIGFMSNLNEESYLISEKGQRAIASNLCKAIVSYNRAYGQALPRKPNATRNKK
ncbi:MAG: N-acetylmuramoyl-L-alanine amidase [Bacteroidia bacterium]|nr:N-acetylmuramoyl-L-alanine amidase [Bacteroidia bacterium]